MGKIDYKLMREIKHEFMWVPSNFQRHFNYWEFRHKRMRKRNRNKLIKIEKRFMFGTSWYMNPMKSVCCEVFYA